MGIKSTSITLTSIILLTAACKNSRYIEMTETNAAQIMENEQSLTLTVGEVRPVTMQSRGAAGLQLQYRSDSDSVVQIQRKEYSPSETSKLPPTNVGGSIPAVFEIKALRPGEAKITFYETRPWDNNFKEIVRQRMTIKVKGP